ncbi:MAG: hypothetical protein ACK5HP_00960 [Bacilli bacterium]
MVNIQNKSELENIKLVDTTLDFIMNFDNLYDNAKKAIEELIVKIHKNQQIDNIKNSDILTIKFYSIICGNDILAFTFKKDNEKSTYMPLTFFTTNYNDSNISLQSITEVIAIHFHNLDENQETDIKKKVKTIDIN